MAEFLCGVRLNARTLY